MFEETAYLRTSIWGSKVNPFLTGLPISVQPSVNTNYIIAGDAEIRRLNKHKFLTVTFI